MSKLVAALAFYHNGDGHQFVKLFGDGTEETIAEQHYQAAINTAKGWRWYERAYFINEAPALVWAKVGLGSAQPQPFFLRAWDTTHDERPLRCAARFSHRPGVEDRYSIPVGPIGYIVPTRDKERVRRLARKYPSVVRDKMWLPVDIIARIHERNVQARQMRRQQAITDWATNPDRAPQYRLLGADFRPH